MAKKKTAGLDQVLDRLRRGLDGLINLLVEHRVNEAFAAVQALGKSKAKAMEKQQGGEKLYTFGTSSTAFVKCDGYFLKYSFAASRFCEC